MQFTNNLHNSTAVHFKGIITSMDYMTRDGDVPSNGEYQFSTSEDDHHKIVIGLLTAKKEISQTHGADEYKGAKWRLFHRRKQCLRYVQA